MRGIGHLKEMETIVKGKKGYLLTSVEFSVSLTSFVS